jgi:FkbM family methyltransferase
MIGSALLGVGMFRLLCLATRSVSSFRGRWWLIRRLMKKDAYLKRLRPRVIRVRAVGRMLVSPKEFIGRYLYVHGEYEGEVVQLFQSIVRPGDCVLDVGANIGYFTLLSSRLAGRQGAVHAFEPSSPTLEKLSTNVGLNAASNVTVHRCAVTDYCGTVDFYDAPDENSGLSSLRNLGSATRRVVHVNARSIDSMLGDLPVVRLVKIDVEGAEAAALCGMRDLIQRDHPFIVLELSDAFLQEMGSSSDTVYLWLTEAGYRVYRIDGGLHPMQRATAEQCNVLCVPAGVVVPPGIDAMVTRGKMDTATMNEQHSGPQESEVVALSSDKKNTSPC